MRLNFEFFVAKGSLFNFLIFCNKLDFQKAERVPPFTILKPSPFLSLRYSADFRRSRLVLMELFSLFVYSPYSALSICRLINKVYSFVVSMMMVFCIISNCIKTYLCRYVRYLISTRTISVKDLCHALN